MCFKGTTQVYQLQPRVATSDNAVQVCLRMVSLEAVRHIQCLAKKANWKGSAGEPQLTEISYGIVLVCHMRYTHS